MKTRGKFVGGGFVAPVIAPPENAFAGSMSSFAPAKENNGSKQAAQPVNLMAIPAIQREYWAEMDVEVAKQHAARLAKEEEMKRQLEQYEDELMDEGGDDDADEYDAYGIKLPPRPKKEGEAAATRLTFEDTKVPQPTKMTVQDLFSMYAAKIDPSGSPLGIIDETGNYFRFFFPPGVSGTKLASLLTDVSALYSVLVARYGHQAEERASATMILPTPVSVSPLAMVLLRDSGRARYTDAISSLVLLVELYMGIRELDVSNPAHKKACDAYDIKLNRFVSARFYAELDAIVKATRVPAEYRQEKDGRAYVNGLLRRYAAACDAYALAKIHVLEWAILDLLRVPYILRPALMTPSGLPTDAGKALIGQSFPILRLNLCRYTRNRNKILCAKYEDETESAEKRKNAVRIVGQAEDAFMPMNPDLPPIEDRLHLLASYNKNDKAMELIASKCIYGIHNGWIDLHTLHEWLFFLSTDDRGKGQEGEFTGPKMALTEDQEAIKAAEEAGDAVPMDIDDQDD